MSSNLVIVAIPEEGDRVWKVSSEKVPHLTLLFLGDVDQVQNLESIVGFVEHAASTSLKRFYLPVDRRGELGADNADVLFFKKNRYDVKAVRDFRSLLLKDTNIKSAFDATSQFELPAEVGAAGQPWIPHLTLGYPETPAKPIPDDHISTFYDVCFDKVAVWTGDFDGPEFLLKDYWDDVDEIMDAVPTDLSYSDIRHYGTKGMRWGVRNAKGGSNTSGVGEKKQGLFEPSGHDVATDVVKSVLWPMVPPLGVFAIPAQVRLIRGGARGAQAKATNMDEKKFTARAHSEKNFVSIHNGAQDSINRGIAETNKKFPGDLSKSPKKQKEYDDEILKVMQDGYRQSANAIGNKKSTMHLDVEFKNDGQDFKITAKEGPSTPLPKQVKHAAEDEELEFEVELPFTGKIKRDAMGHILGFDFDGIEQTPPVEHAQAVGSAFVASLLDDEDALAHYGVKGMHWGVRKAPPEAVGAVATSHVPQGNRRKTKVKTEGGENHPASEDALKVAQHRAKLAKSGPAALSNKELQEVANRVELEVRVKRAVQPAGKKFVSNLLKNQGNQQANQFVTTQVRRGVRKAAVGV